MFHVAADNRFPYWVYGGQQESGSAGVASRGDYGAITFRDWHTVGVEEYGYAAPDPLHPGIIFGGKVTRYDERTGDVQNVGPVVVRDGKDRFVRTAPILFSPADPHVLFFATQRLYKTVNGGRSWTIISPDLSRAASGVPPSLGVYADEARKTEHRGVIYAIGPSPLDVNVIWTGSDDGVVHVTRDGGAHWEDVTPTSRRGARSHRSTPRTPIRTRRTSLSRAFGSTISHRSSFARTTAARRGRRSRAAWPTTPR